MSKRRTPDNESGPEFLPVFVVACFIPTDCGMGRPRTLAIDGSPTPLIGDWPWHVRIWSEESISGPMCEGVLVDDVWVLTTSSCSEYEELTQILVLLSYSTGQILIYITLILWKFWWVVVDIVYVQLNGSKNITFRSWVVLKGSYGHYICTVPVWTVVIKALRYIVCFTWNSFIDYEIETSAWNHLKRITASFFRVTGFYT